MFPMSWIHKVIPYALIIQDPTQKQPPEVFYKKDVLKSFSFLIKLKPRPATLLKKRLWHRYFPFKICEIFKSTLLKEHLRVTACEIIVNFAEIISFENKFSLDSGVSKKYILRRDSMHSAKVKRICVVIGRQGKTCGKGRFPIRCVYFANCSTFNNYRYYFVLWDTLCTFD